MTGYLSNKISEKVAYRFFFIKTILHLQKDNVLYLLVNFVFVYGLFVVERLFVDLLVDVFWCWNSYFGPDSRQSLLNIASYILA